VGPSNLPAQQEPAKSFDDVEAPKLNDIALRDFLEYCTPSLILEKFSKVRDPWTKRYYHQTRLERGHTVRLHQIDCYAADVEGVSSFIEAVKEEEKVRGECKIYMNEDGMVAEWEEHTPLSPAEIKESEDWLAANLKQVEQKIKFRAPQFNLENK